MRAEIIQRDFIRELDLPGMLELARKFPARNTHVVDLPYRFSSWALDEPANSRLWIDSEGELVAWAVLQTPFWTFDFACHPEDEEEVLPDLLVWADQRAWQVVDTPLGHPSWFVNVFAHQAERIHLLEKSGFTSQAEAGEDAWSQVLLQILASEEIQNAIVPEGFTIRPFHGESEVAKYVELHQAVFGTRNMTEPWRMRTLQRPEHVPECDLVATAPDGRLAAFCVGWLCQWTDGSILGQIEPMGVWEDYRHRGLGKAILTECLRRLRLYGAGEIYVETDNYRDAALELYESAGFRKFQDILVFRKGYAR